MVIFDTGYMLSGHKPEQILHRAVMRNTLIINNSFLQSFCFSFMLRAGYDYINYDCRVFHDYFKLLFFKHELREIKNLHSIILLY